MSGRATRASATKASAAISASYNGRRQEQAPARPGRVVVEKIPKRGTRTIAARKATHPSRQKKASTAKANLENGLASEINITPDDTANNVKITGDTAAVNHVETGSPIAENKSNGSSNSVKSAAGKRKRRSAVKVEDDPDELPHNLGNLKSPVKTDTAKQKREKTKVKIEDVPETNSLVEKASSINGTGKLASPKKASKANPYGLTPGVSPYPNWPHPTPEECMEVVRLLSAVHGEVNAPETIPPPSVTVSGCGEVPSILDALIRTLLSAATTGANSSRAFQGLVQKFGILQEGIGKGSVDWNKVRLANVKDVADAIRSGGLADSKSKNIKTILEMVYEQNIARRDALVNAKNEDDESKGPAGVENETIAQKEMEIVRAENHVLSLDHLHALDSDSARDEMIKFPGIGPKTASCVLLFCMRRPSFAVDTHVFRLCKWLGWVPPDKATRNSTYSHCDVRIPDELKYPLHALFIRHGKTCPRCRASTGETSERWDEGCPIEHLVQRTGKRKGGGESPVKKVKKAKTTKRKKTKRPKKAESDEEDEEESDLVLDDDDDEELSDVPEDTDDMEA